jgi:outer membrane protein
MRALLAALLCLAAGASHALDLMDAYGNALAHDPSALAAREALAAGREKAVQGDALLLPQVSFTAGYTHVEDRVSTQLPPVGATPFSPESSGEIRQAALQLKQPLYDARAAADRKQLHERTTLSGLEYRTSRQDLMQRVSDAYFQVLLAEEQLRVVLAEKAALGMQRERAQARFEVGRGRITDLQETQARYDGVLTREITARSNLAVRQARFREATGLDALGIARLREGFQPALPGQAGLEDWQRKALAANARVQARRSELVIAKAETRKHDLAARPTLDLVASYAYRGQAGGLSPFIAPDSDRNAAIGVQLTIPLFAGGGIDSREREALARLREAEYQVAAAERDARLQVQDAFLGVQSSAARVGSLGESVRSARTALEATTLGRDVGTRTELDVLDAQQRLYANQLDLAQARIDYLLGRVRLAQAAGELEESDLQALNAYLEP